MMHYFVAQKMRKRNRSVMHVCRVVSTMSLLDQLYQYITNNLNRWSDLLDYISMRASERCGDVTA
jgi:hypothetical protein